MTAAANLKCPECGGEFEPIEEQPRFFRCKSCNERLHQIAATHYELLTELTEGDDPAVSDLADALLAYDGGAR